MLRPVLLLALLVPLAGCLDEEPGGTYYVLEAVARLAADPPEENRSNCGRPGGAHTGVDLEGEHLVMVKGHHDLDAATTWLVVVDDVEATGASQCWNQDFVYVARRGFDWTWELPSGLALRETHAVARDGETVLLEGRPLVPEVPVTFGVSGGNPPGRVTGNLTFTLHGPWRFDDIVEVPSEDDVTAWRGYWWMDRLGQTPRGRF